MNKRDIENGDACKYCGDWIGFDCGFPVSCDSCMGPYTPTGDGSGIREPGIMKKKKEGRPTSGSRKGWESADSNEPSQKKHSR